MSRQRKYYSVYNRKTEMPVFIHGTSDECMRAMGVKPRSFYSYVSHNLRNSRDCKWEIIVEGPEEDGNYD